MTCKTTVILADDHPVVLAGLEHYMRRANFDVVAAVDEASALSEALRTFDVDIAVTDFSFGGDGDGMRMIDRMHRMNPRVKIVVFSRIRQIGSVRQLLAGGADAFVSKTVGLEYVVHACRAVLANSRYVDPSTEKLLYAATGHQDDIRVRSSRDPEEQLSVREREVLRLLAQGLGIREIADRFQRSPKTISVQKCAAMSKLGLRKEIELALYLAKCEERE